MRSAVRDTRMPLDNVFVSRFITLGPLLIRTRDSPLVPAGPVQELNFDQHRTVQVPQDAGSSDADNNTGAGDAVITSDSGSANEAADGFVLPRKQMKRQNRCNNANIRNKIVLGKGCAGGLTASARR